MPRASAAGPQNDEVASVSERASERQTFAMIDAHEGFPLRFIAALPLGVGR
jgi:hypothetical protein